MFRMPKEERDFRMQHACYIETYPSAEEAEAGAETFGGYWYVYSSGNSVLSIDRSIKNESAEKYAEAFQKAVGGEVKRHHTEERSSVYKTYDADVEVTKADGIQPTEIYDAFKKKIDNIEFNCIIYEIGCEEVGFSDRSQGYDQGVSVHITAFDEDVETENGPDPNGGYNLIRKNVLVHFWDDLPEERIAEYAKVLDNLLK